MSATIEQRLEAVESELAALKAKVANPDARPERTPQQEADSMSASQVRSIKGMYLTDQPLAASARWAEVSPDAIRILLKLNKTAVRA